MARRWLKKKLGKETEACAGDGKAEIHPLPLPELTDFRDRRFACEKLQKITNQKRGKFLRISKSRSKFSAPIKIITMVYLHNRL